MAAETEQKFSPIQRALQRESQRGGELKRKILTLIREFVAGEPEGLSYSSIHQVLDDIDFELRGLPVKFIGYADEAGQPLT
jgi:hypothetical protein